MVIPTGKSVTGAAFLPGDRLLTVGYEPGTALWDVSDAGPREVGAVTTETGVSFGFEFSPDGSQIASFTRPGGFEVVTLADGESSVTLGDQAHEYNTTGVRTVGPGFSLVGSFGDDGSGAIQRLPSLEVVRQLDPCTSAVAFSPDDSLAVVTGWSCTDPPPAGATAAVMDIATGTTRFELPLRWVGSAAFTAPEGGGDLLAVRGDGWNGNAVGFFDVATGDELGTFTGMQVPLLLSTSPDGRYVVVGSQEGRVVAFDAVALGARSTIEAAVVFDVVAHTGPTPWPAVSDGGLVATSGFDGLVRLWDMASGEMVVELRKGGGDVFPVLEFSPDGEYLHYADSANLIRRFPVDSERLVALAQSRLVRDLTVDECRRYFPQEGCPGSG